ncbi:hypothetical protein AWZ03_009136 [Drosophila navojoa]|uniref:Chitin-binding type-2 domain-containing protein n=1 Tax=Drosophila navojoa TaxID=7232 RepID=A0A484B8S0_DRONA|nr:uncharacterized protein LOC108658611 [Drosophila navojoa]TDG44440.1 hypothetical protein AWZ03_009136 [Drosophila navojoa]
MQPVLQLCLLLLLLLGAGPALGELGCSSDGFCFCTGHQEGDLVPDCTDCRAFYRCGVDNIKHELCPPALIFDVQQLACVPGKCPRSDGECAAPNVTTTRTPAPTTAPPHPSPPATSCLQQEVECSFHGQILPHAEHCRFFWTCVEDCPVLGFCELGKWFDRQNFVCDFPQNVQNCPVGRD